MKHSRNEIQENRNYSFFRKKWDHQLISNESKYIISNFKKSIRKTAIYGTGNAAISLSKILSLHDIVISNFITDRKNYHQKNLNGIPIFNLKGKEKQIFDLIIVGSQFFFEIENNLTNKISDTEIIFPIVQR